MKLWQRLLITILVMLGASLVASVVWRSVFEPAMPGYLAGVVGGLAALATWEALRSRK